MQFNGVQNKEVGAEDTAQWEVLAQHVQGPGLNLKYCKKIETPVELNS